MRIVNSDTVNLSGSANVASKNVDSYNSFATNNLISSNSNYMTTGGTVAVDITAAPLTVTAQADTRVYNGTISSNVSPVVTGTLYDPIGTNAIQTFDNRNVGVNKLLTASGLIINDGNNGNNYAITYVNNSNGVITAAPLTITADNTSRLFGEPNPAFTATYTGLQTGDTSNVVSGLTITTPATINSPVGNYPIIPANGSAMNYTISYVNGELTITNVPPAPTPSIIPNLASIDNTIVNTLNMTNADNATINNDQNSKTMQKNCAQQDKICNTATIIINITPETNVNINVQP